MNILRYQHLLKRFGLKSAASLYEHADSGILTKPVKVGPKAAGWPEHEIDAILAARAIGASNDEIRAIVKDLHAKREAALAELRAKLASEGGSSMSKTQSPAVNTAELDARREGHSAGFKLASEGVA